MSRTSSHTAPNADCGCVMTAQPLTAARKALTVEREGLERLEQALNGPLGVALEQAIAQILSAPGRLIITGIGKSGHIGRKIQATLASTGTPALFLHPAEAAHGDLGIIQPGDIVLALSSSGESVELAPLLAFAAHNALPLIGITSSAKSSLGRSSTVCLLLPPAQEACPLNLAPTTSSLLQLALGDALAIALMEKRHFTSQDFSRLHPAGQIGARLRPVRELMHTGSSMPLGPPTLPLRSVIIEMTRKAFGCIGVVDHERRLCGLIADGDLRRALKRDLDRTTAADIMNPNPLTTSPGTLMQDALHQMHDRAVPVSSLFVLDDQQRPLGILHLHDFLQAGVL